MKAFILLALIACSFAADLDGDGFDSDPSFGEFQDCCDTVDDGCYDPYLVNPGAWEIPNNGIADRCVEGRDKLNNIPCDSSIGTSSIYYQFIGPDTTPSETEPAILAMDICEFKDDDDDPSWGFARQENMVFSLADGTRNGYDIGVIGPHNLQASVVRRFGNIFPANGDYFMAISTQVAQDARGPNGSGVGLFPTSSIVLPPSEWVSGSAVGIDENLCRWRTAISAADSVMATFAMQQPTNMNAWSVKVVHLDSKRRVGEFAVPGCEMGTSRLIVLQNTTSSTDKNVAIDNAGYAFRSSNPNVEYFTECREYSTLANGEITCPNSFYHLINTGGSFSFGSFPYGTEWIPVGASAIAGEPFQLKLATWDVSGDLDTSTFLIDDYIPVSEARTFDTSFGYQFTADLELDSVIPTVPGIYPVGTTVISLAYSIKNNGPEVAGDVTINFTPPKGTSFSSITGDLTSQLLFKQAAAPYQANSFYKYTRSAPLAVGQSYSGFINFNVLADAPSHIQFKLSATCSSIEKIFNNNYKIQMVYIERA